MTPLSHLTAEELADMAIQHAGTVGGIDEDDVGIEILLRECAVRLRQQAGWVMVPREPTAAMIEAHIGECAGDADEAGPDRIRDCWHAMLATASAQGGGEET